MHIQFAELSVFNQDRAIQFYSSNFDCKVVADDPMSNDGWRWVEMKFTGARTTLHFLKRNDETPSAEPVLVLVDEHIAATVNTLKANGVEIITELQPAPYDSSRTVAEFRDSEGNFILISNQ
jgi:predicted enzyme related to lactoylglutathione lyase